MEMVGAGLRTLPKDGAVIRFTGNVTLTFPGGATLTADEVVVNANHEAVLRGTVRLRFPSQSK